MKSNWIEIKRFLNDYKKIILIGAIIIAAIFTVGVSWLENREDDSTEINELFTEEFINDVQPAYYQVFIEYEDGVEFGNSSIIEEYFTLDSVIEDVNEELNIDLKAIKKEVNEELATNTDTEIKLINVTRDNSSYLWTATFNVGDEEENLKLARYYFDLLLSDEIALLNDKQLYVFEEPRMLEDVMTEEEINRLEEEQQVNKTSPIESYARNAIIGLILGLVAMIGILLLKIIYGKKLEYSFGYDVVEEDKFVLYDQVMGNLDLMHQFIANPAGDNKLILSEVALTADHKNLLSKASFLTFAAGNKPVTKLTELHSFGEIDPQTVLTEIIILVLPGKTTRQWYNQQLQFAEINDLTAKVIQLND